MANVFDKILSDSATRGIVPSRTVDARNWFRSEAQKVGARSASPSRLIGQLETQSVEGISMGSMYLFGYDPKLNQAYLTTTAFP